MTSGRGTPWRTRSVALFVSLILTFGLVEWAARAYVFHVATEKQFRRFASLAQMKKKYAPSTNGEVLPALSPHRYLGYYPTPGYALGDNRHNSLGYRGDEIVLPKPPGEFRIVCLGDSTTYTTRVPDYTQSFPHLLEQELRSRGLEHVTVVNGGASGWTSWETFVNFALRALDLEPDLVIVYHGNNEVHTRLVWPPAAYTSDNRGYRAARTAPSNFRWFEHSTALRILAVRAGLIRPHIDVKRTVDPISETSYAREFGRQRELGSYPDGLFNEVSAQQMLETNRPIYFRRNIEHLVAIAKFRNVDVLLATFASSPEFIDEPLASSEEYLSAYQELGFILQDIAREMDVHLFDFGSRFPTDARYFVDGYHVNARGAQLKARVFADYIVEHHLVN